MLTGLLLQNHTDVKEQYEFFAKCSIDPGQDNTGVLLLGMCHRWVVGIGQQVTRSIVEGAAVSMLCWVG